MKSNFDRIGGNGEKHKISVPQNLISIAAVKLNFLPDFGKAANQILIFIFIIGHKFIKYFSFKVTYI